MMVLKIFQFGDGYDQSTDFVIAESMESATKCLSETVGLPDDELQDHREQVDDATIDSLIVCIVDHECYSDSDNCKNLTFREAMDLMIKEKRKFPTVLASSE